MKSINVVFGRQDVREVKNFSNLSEELHLPGDMSGDDRERGT